MSSPSPTTPPDVKALLPDPSSGLCDNFLSALIQIPLKFYAFLNWLLDSDGNFHADIQKTIRDWSTPPGTIIMSGAVTTPAGYLLCNGAAVSRTTYADLFTAIGTTFGVGDGSSTFNLPNFDERFPTGTGVKPLAQVGGGEVTLAPNNIPEHKHMSAWNAATTDTPSLAWEDIQGSEPITGQGYVVGRADSQFSNRVHPYGEVNDTTNAPVTIEPKYLVVKFLIKT